MNEPDDGKLPFGLQAAYDQRELLGARWWQQRLAAPRGGSTSRREALGVIAALGGLAVIGGSIVAAHVLGNSRSSAPLERDSLELQRAFGFAATANETRFAWPDPIDVDAADRPLDRTTLPRLAEALTPRDPVWQPAYVPTLFQVLADSHSGPLVDLFQMIRSPAMVAAFAQGEALRELLPLLDEPTATLLVVDLAGPASVALAAGLAEATTTVFTFGNWPHPLGVVPSHQTLAAAVYHRPHFAQPADGVPRPAVLVLDRNRLTPYANQTDRFDNRYRARVPSAEDLRQRGVRRVLYVLPAGAEPRELDDLNESFVAWQEAGITVKLFSVGDLEPESGQPTATGSATRRYFWHGSPGYHPWLWHAYGWPSRRPGGLATATPPPFQAFTTGYVPHHRVTMFTAKPRFGRTLLPDPANSGGGSWSRSGARSWGGVGS